jgi:hypothetical protein
VQDGFFAISTKACAIMSLCLPVNLLGFSCDICNSFCLGEKTMKLLPIYRFQTSEGLAEIAYNPITRRFHAVFERENLGSYVNAAQAIDDLAGGHTDTPSSGVDLSKLAIPQDTVGWTRVS